MNQKIQEEWAELKYAFSDLDQMKQKGDRWIISGHLPIVDANGMCWEIYEVEIALNEDFPRSLPAICETGGKIIRAADWHVFDDNSCCVGTEARQYHLLDGTVNLLKWVQRLAIPFLANHKLKVLDKNYANGERSHGASGELEEYEDIFKNRNDISLLNYLKLISDQSSIGRNNPCFCGSGKKYKRCFLQNKEAHRKNIPVKVILKDILIFKDKGLLK